MRSGQRRRGWSPLRSCGFSAFRRRVSGREVCGGFGVEMDTELPCRLDDGLTPPVWDIALDLPGIDRLDGSACLIGDCCAFSQLSENPIHDVHAPTYPLIGYIMQGAYPIFSKAAAVPSWQTVGMAARPPEPIFDLDAVKQRMIENNVTQTQVARALGLNQSAVSNLLAGRRQVKVHEAVAIYRYLRIETSPGVVFVPIIGISSAGNWREAIELPRGALPIPTDLAGTRAFAVEISGDSMDLLVPEGAFVVVDPDQTQLFNDKVYLIDNGENETQVKLYRSNPARFEPASRNETHSTIFVGNDSVTVIGRVVWQGQPL